MEGWMEGWERGMEGKNAGGLVRGAAGMAMEGMEGKVKFTREIEDGSPETGGWVLVSPGNEVGEGGSRGMV